ncbi:unnamed protein product [Lactuca virosa]|uniref:Uncharacterized protein n=1 Tax=Lactuca virosa TaxID=75947 RepID=A0AAU9N0W1_9ASTR|nr:unnamed protein product [Lactuca virosa]
MEKRAAVVVSIQGGRYVIREDYGDFIERFELLPFPQPPPPAAKQPLSGLTFAVSDVLLGIFARDPSVLHRVGHVLRLNPVEPRRKRRIVVADDLCQLSKVHQQKTVYIVSKVTEKLSGFKKGNVDSSRKTRSSSKREKANEVSQTRSKTSKKTAIEQPKVKLRVKVKTVSKKRELSDEDDSDFQSRPGSSKKPNRETKVLKKDKKSLSREQKDCVRAMGFGSLLGMKMIDVPLKIVYYVFDHFNFESLKVEFDNCEVSVDKKIRFLEDILQESGGFGCGHVNEAYVEEEFQESEYNEEESGGDDVESDGEEDLCDEDEEDFDVNKVSDVEVYESKISCMYQKMEDLKKDLVVKIDEGVLKFPQSQNLKIWKLLFLVEDLSTKSFDFRYVSQKYKESILKPGFVQVNDEDYGNDFLNDDENVEDYDQGKCSGGQGDGSGPHEGNIGKHHVEGKGDYDEDDEQGNGSGCVSFSQFICDPVVESFLKTLDQGTDGCLNQKLVEDDVNLNLTGIEDGTVNLGEDDHKNKVISDRTVDKIIVAKKDGEENVEDCSNKNKDSNETRSLKNDLVPSFSLGFSQDYEGSKKSSQSQISSERMIKKKIKDRVILGKPSAGPECVIPNVDVIDASPVSFAPLLGTLERPSKPVSGKHKDINEEATQ